MSFSLNNGCYSLSRKPHRNPVKAGVLRRIKIRKKSVIDVDSIFFETKNARPSDLSGGRWRRNGFNHQHMKKRVITLGVAALGVAGAQAADGKLWEVSASLKGFYDDNYTTVSYTHLRAHET